MTQATNQTRLSLTRDELLALLQIMGATTMNGLPDDPLAGLAERERAERLNSGLETLLNRNLAEANADKQLVLDDTLVALVGSCIIPEATFLLTALQADGANEPHYINATPQILVEHELPRAGIHVFNYLADGEQLQTRVQALLAGLQPIPLATPFTGALSDVALAQALQAARTNQPAQAQHMLVQQHWSAAEAHAWVEAAIHFPIYTAVCASGMRSQPTPSSQTLMAVCSLARCWLMWPAPDAADHFVVQAVTGQACIGAFVALFQPLVRVGASA